MTNREAIERLEELIPCGDCIRTSWSIHKHGKEVDAMKLAITALREKAEKERRFVVRRHRSKPFEELWEIVDIKANGMCISARIKTESDANRIADIYEEMYK